MVAYEKGRPRAATTSFVSPRFFARRNVVFVRAVIPELLMIFLFKTKERAVRSDSHLPRRRDHHLSFKRSPNAIIFVGDKKSHFAAENFSFYRKVLSSSTNFAVPHMCMVCTSEDSCEVDGFEEDSAYTYFFVPLSLFQPRVS